MTGNRRFRGLLRALALAAALGLAAPAVAQLIGGGLPGVPVGGGLPGGLPGGLVERRLPEITEPVRRAKPLPQVEASVAELVRAPLSEVRRLTAEQPGHDVAPGGKVS